MKKSKLTYLFLVFAEIGFLAGVAIYIYNESKV